MKSISQERKQAILNKLLPPHNQSVALIAKQEHVGESTLYKWLKKLKSEGVFVQGSNKNSEAWSAEAQFAVIVETATLNQQALAEYRLISGTNKTMETSIH